MMWMPGRSILVALIASLALMGSTLLPSEAEACSWMGGALETTLPADGAQIPPETEFSIWFKPGGSGELEFKLIDEDGDEVAIEVIYGSYGSEMGFVGHYQMLPETALEPGEYTLESHQPDEVYYLDEVALSVEVVDDTVESPGMPESLFWTRLDNPPRSECHGQAIQWQDLDIEEERDDIWFDVTYETEEGEEFRAGHPATNPLRHYLRDRVDCLTVVAVAIDGTRSDPVTRCEPDHCREGVDNMSLEDIPCDPEAAADGNGGSSSSCSASGDNSPGSLWWMVLLGGFMAIRRRSLNLSN